jgi:hypothetical protein
MKNKFRIFIMILKQGDKMRIKINLHFCLTCLILFACNPNIPDTKNKSVADTNTVQADPNQLVGDWIRTDGGYRIRILIVTPDGKLDAGYFNPNPIHVGQAEWKVMDKNIIITVVLQDVNYPGSTYTLQYFPTEDRLAGNYFQAVERANYGVEFMRQK